jgi:DNA polymerase-1
MPVQLPLDEVLARLKPWLENPDRKKLGQNLKYDEHVLANHGIRMAGVVHDTMLESYVVESHRSHDMDGMAQRHLGLKTIKYEEVCGKGASQIGFDDVPVDQASEYAAEDADITLRLHEFLYPLVKKSDGLEHVYAAIEVPVSRVLWQIERNGVLIDAARLEAQSSEIGAKLIDLEKQAHELAGGEFNLNSPKQIGSSCRSSRRHRAARRRPMRKCSRNSPKIIRCRSCCSISGVCRSLNRPIPTSFPE